ncbi:MAG TPA: SigE family RNA polymerase sigma factor [Stackebrandtia sp.]|jgi:RNA polymerase sigma-70 factor (sigma-E family)|uniref:SigE family RNA polymerase sigma factor n=1 Tax=Stackebrandtia sp. TaxID=2023065 RepID=UPI002D60AD7A|nr:SigE family RNA polymerase sigma factor [Stackebrandtia sp.]HZE40640.1 SigE family RNA polymerase sigma factor [Stackebrandtia sp.]
MNPESEQEFKVFVSTNIDHLCRFAFLLCRDWQRAEDTVQKALTRLYLRWHRVNSSTPRAYVSRIVVNLLHDERRLFRFQRERSTSEPPEEAQADHAEATTTRLAMLEALSRLPARQRLAVVLRFWEDLSVEQTAEIMKCSQGTVKSQTARGLQTLRGLLGKPIPTQVEGANQ